MSEMAGPLSGVRVLDLSALAPGPFATMLLGDLGAEVITVEAPAAARSGSGLGQLPGYGGERARRQGINPLYRSRRSLVLDLKQPQALNIALQLAQRSDVFIEGFRPGTCERLGLGYDTVATRNPAIVYCSLTGYGQSGELSMRAGHDLNYIAESGLLSATTRDGQRPGIPVNAAADFAAGGLLAAFGILAGLLGRQSTGRGTYIDVSMYEGLLGLLQVAQSWTLASAPDPSWGRGLLSGAVPFYDCYRTADGQWLSVAALEPKFFANLCTALGRPDLIPAHADQSQWPELRAVFEESFSTASLAEWLARLDDVDTAVAPVRSLPDAFEAALRRGLLDTPGMVGPLPRMSAWKPTAGSVVTRPGQHTREILDEIGLSPDEIETLLAAGAVMA
jgi:alpha-methylacyl-CoA racemase